MTKSSLMLISVLALAGCQHATKSNGGDDSWRREFHVEKANLGVTGSNPFFDLTPGRVRTYTEGDATLTIRVLAETKVVDGVTTRIVEEREEVGGRLKEISRNYFAIDRATGDLYYFGEDVDDYKDGKVSGHGGAWLSGVNGARFGLFVPAHPKVGDRFYQELAPGVAMDRMEVVSVSERIVTPAGTFEKCVHMRETTPLERATGQKWFCAGAGLVKDDDSVLVSMADGK